MAPFFFLTSVSLSLLSLLSSSEKQTKKGGQMYLSLYAKCSSVIN